MSDKNPTNVELAEWGFALLCPDEKKRSEAAGKTMATIRTLQFQLYQANQKILELEARKPIHVIPPLTKIYGKLK